MTQLALQWPAAQGFEPEQFIACDANREAYDFIMRFPSGAQKLGLLVGPEASGKTHLMHCWAERTGARFIEADDLGKTTSEQLLPAGQYGILENIEAIKDETGFFHLLRHAELSETCLMLTSRLPVKSLAFEAADIRSRLLALPVAHIAEPDEALLHSFYAKAFSDRQWRVLPQVIDYLCLHAERRFAVARAIIGELDTIVASTKKEITLKTIKPLIDKPL